MALSAGIKRFYGKLKQSPDPRDCYYIVPDTRRLSAFSDQSPGMGPQLDQKAEGSCGPNTAAELIAFDQKSQGLPVGGASRLHIYWWTRFLMGTVGQDSGVDNRTMCKALATYGFVSPESMYPYDDTKARMVQKPPDSVNAAALPNKLTSYAAVVQNLGQMQGVIDNGRPFLFGFEVFQQMESEECAMTGILAMPAPGQSPVGGHDISLCGFNATGHDLPGEKPGNKWPSGYFKARNHWMNGPGVPWGDNGYAYVPFGYATNAKLANDFWVFNAIPGGVTPPDPTPPGPTPVPPAPVPPQPVPVGPTPLFRPLTFHQGVKPGGKVTFAAPGAIPVGSTLLIYPPARGAEFDGADEVTLIYPE